MRFPAISFFAAFLIWILSLAVFSFFLFKRSEIPQISLVLDAQVIGEVEKEKNHQHSESQKNQSSEEHSPQDASFEEKNFTSQKVMPIHQPLPQIPQELRREAFSSAAVARFYIQPDGSVSQVELIHPCQNPRLNQLLLKSLKNWKFAPSSGTTTQDIRVTFKVERL